MVWKPGPSGGRAIAPCTQPDVYVPTERASPGAGATTSLQLWARASDGSMLQRRNATSHKRFICASICGSVMVPWHHQLGQTGELIVDGRPGDHGAHNKLRDANLHKGVDTAQHSVRRAPGGVGLEGDAWINALHQRGDLRTDILVAKVKGDNSPVMVLWHSPLVLLSSLANGAHGLA